MQRIPLAIVGLGKIARDQHVPALRASDAFELLAIASPHGRLEGVSCYRDLEALLQGTPRVSAVAICTSPQVRYAIARLALEQGRHVLLEKPPGATTAEVRALAALAATQGVALFASWHSRHAPAVEPARAWLAGRSVREVVVTWKEDVRVWHPGQRWIWQAGGFGVFDPGINALSILTRILPGVLAVLDAELMYPANCESPIAAQLRLESDGGIRVRASFDFRHAGVPAWDIVVETDAGRLTLSAGGSSMSIDGRAVATAPSAEYPSLYVHFAELVRARRVDVDAAPLQLVADALLCGRRVRVEPFIE